MWRMEVVLLCSKETILESDDPWRLLDFIPLHRNGTSVPYIISSSSGGGLSWGGVSRPDCTTSGIRGRAACVLILGLLKTTQGTLGAKHCLIIGLQSMAGRRLSIKQSYAIIYQRLFSQEDHTFDPKKEDWSGNKNEFLTPVQIQSRVQSVARSYSLWFMWVIKCRFDSLNRDETLMWYFRFSWNVDIVFLNQRHH